MQKKSSVLTIYMYPLLISATVALAVLALKAVSDPLVIVSIILGALLGTFLMDMEYIIYALIFEPEKDFSKDLTAFIKHGDFANAARYIEYHKHDVKDKSLNSAIFQIVLGFLALYVMASTAPLIVKVFVLSVYGNSMYKLAEMYFNNQIQEWFWAMKEPPSKQGLVLYSFLLIGSFVFCLYML